MEVRHIVKYCLISKSLFFEAIAIQTQYKTIYDAENSLGVYFKFDSLCSSNSLQQKSLLFYNHPFYIHTKMNNSSNFRKSFLLVIYKFLM